MKVKILLLVTIVVLSVFLLNYTNLILDFIEYHTVHDSSHSYRNQENAKNDGLMLREESDPLGQQAKIDGSIPIIENESIAISNSSPNIIKRIQLTLLLSDYYTKEVDGILNTATTQAIIKYQKDHYIDTNHSNYIDSKTLNSLGVVIND